MTWRIYLRNYHHCVGLCKRNHFFDIADAVTTLLVIRTFQRQLGMAESLECERFVIYQVPMQLVELGDRHGFDCPLDSSQAEEVPHRIHQDASVLHDGLIIQLAALEPTVIDKLEQGLQSIHIPVVVGKSQYYPLLLHIDAVLLLLVLWFHTDDDWYDFIRHTPNPIGSELPLQHLVVVVLSVKRQLVSLQPKITGAYCKLLITFHIGNRQGEDPNRRHTNHRQH